jgi:hypothetical protein
MHHDHDDRRTHERAEEIYTGNDARVRREVTMDRFGGLDLPATMVGALVAFAATAILGATAGALLGTTIFGDTGSIQAQDVVPAAIVGGLVLALAYYTGGWAAGRIARYNGARNGVFAALWTIVLVVAAGAAAVSFGDRYDVMSGIGMPNWLSGDEATMGGIAGGVIAIVLMVLFAAIGGRRGEAYHRRADVHLTEPHAHGV